MLKEFNNNLSTHCKDVYMEMMDKIISDLLKLYAYRAIPETSPECEDYVEYLGKLVYTGSKTLKSLPEIYYEAAQFFRKAVEELTPAQRFVCECYFVEFCGKMPSDDDIHASIMENLDTVLCIIGGRVVNE